MGLTSLLMKKSKNVVPGLTMRQLKAAPNFDSEWLQEPLFRDLLACVAQLTHTELDLQRLNSNGYMKRVSYGRATVKDKGVKRLFEALDVDITRLDEDGYITSVIRKMSDAAKAARHGGELSMADNSENALYAVSLVLARHILSLYPDYAQRIADNAEAIKESAK